MDFIEPPVPFDNWTMFAYGNFCKKNQVSRFKKKLPAEEVLKERTDVDDLWNSSLSKLKYYKDVGYCISHVVSNLGGRTQIVTVWFEYMNELVDVYEFISKNKVVDSWEVLCTFIKDCTVVREKRIP